MNQYFARSLGKPTAKDLMDSLVSAMLYLDKSVCARLLPPIMHAGRDVIRAETMWAERGNDKNSIFRGFALKVA